MTTQTIDRAIGEYVGRCVEHLRDLGESERSSILDDIRQILSEVTAELEGAPDDLLGPPDRFVAELRAAAGLGAIIPVKSSQKRTLLGAAVRSRSELRDRFGGFLDHTWWTPIRQFADSLRPAWWMLRGLLVVGLIAQTTSTDGWQSIGGLPIPVPAVFDSRFLGLLTTAAATAGSVLIGRRLRFGWRWWVWPALMALAIVLFVSTFGRLRSDPYVGPMTGATVFLTSATPNPSVTYLDPLPVNDGDSVLMSIGASSGESYSVYGPESAREALRRLIDDWGVPPTEIWVDFGPGPTYFTSESQLVEVVNAFWADY